jgi:heme A synthase
VTSAELAARQAQTGFSGDVAEALHRVLGIGLTVLTLGLGIWTSFAASPGWLRALTWIALAPLAIAAALGWQGPPLPPSLARNRPRLAGSLLPLGYRCDRDRQFSRLESRDRTGRRPTFPAVSRRRDFVFLQIALGTAYRHEVFGIMLHMEGALVVALMTLILSAVILQNSVGPAPMRRAAAALISIVLAQVCLGIASFLMLVLNASGTFAFVLTTSGHLSIGAATLAARTYPLRRGQKSLELSM